MVDAAPFRGLRYDPAVAGHPAGTSAPPYDDVDPATYAQHRTGSPYTVLELLTPPDASGSYRSAAATLARWQRTGVLVHDDAPAFYRYEQHVLRRGVPRVQRGLLAAVAMDADVLPHEAVDADRVADRRARLEAVRADLSPVFALALEAPPQVHRQLAAAPRRPPVVAFTDEVGVDHRVWVMSDPARIRALREALSGVRLLLADGHHRYAAARAARDRQRGAAWQRTLMYIVDAANDGPQVRGVHRLVRGVTPDALRTVLAEFTAEPIPDDADALQVRLDREHGHAFGLLVGEQLAAAAGSRAMLLRPREPATLMGRLPAERSARWRRLDAALLDHAVVPNLRATAVAHRADLRHAAVEAQGASDALLLVLRAVDTATVEALATAGEHLPPKTTSFSPKPRTGLVLRPLPD